MNKVSKAFLFLLMGGMLFVSCKDDDCKECEFDESRRIILSSQVTMGVEPRLQEEQIEQGQALSLFITPNNTPSEVLYENVNIIANGQGGFAAQNMYYPIDGRSVDLFAIHPYSANAKLSENIPFSVQTNQGIQKNYLDSDLLFATRTNQSRANDTISLVFFHKMSKLDITIENNDGLDLSTITSFSVSNILPSTTINPLNGEITAAAGSPVSINAYGVASAPEARASVSGIHAIVVPQTIAANAQLFRFTLGQQVYTFTTTEAFTFLSGNQHAVKLTISAGQITIESSISPWITGGSIGGGVTPE